MREIKFRARHSITGVWHYGCSNPARETTERHLGVFFQDLECGILDSKTLGQYAGYKDKNGKEIYEGDRVQFVESFGQVTEIHPVEFKQGCFTIENPWDPEYNCASVLLANNDSVEVIGNIYET